MPGQQWTEQFNSYTIEVSRIPDARFRKYDFGEGFGWAFKIYYGDKSLAFAVVIKSVLGKRNDTNIQRALVVGRDIVHQRITQLEFNKGELYCYRWESDDQSATPVKCSEIDSPIENGTHQSSC
jgi:hypothetical protein